MQVESSFPKAKKLIQKVLRKIKKKFRIARKSGKKKLVTRLRKKVRGQKELIKKIKECESGEFVNETSDESDSNKPEVQFRRLKVFSELSIQIDPSRGWDQFFGELNFTNVESLSPGGVGVPNDLHGIARVACQNLWGEEAVSGLAAVRIFTFRIATGTKVLLNVPAFWRPQFFAATEGKWISRGGNAESGAVIIAEAGFWFNSYNRRTISRETSILYKGESVALDCRIDEEIRTFYP